MIVFELICPEHHRFEGWFASTNDFERQKDRGQLSCPVCNHASIAKLPIAKIGKQGDDLPRRTTPAMTAPSLDQVKIMNALIDHILVNTENVGNAFPEEARKIHYKEAPLRNIRGIASAKETEELLDEGIAVLPLPVPPRGEWQ
ncbi:MAG: DUF1178 family protein [Betaproteobacteria bacterium]|nr:DUF1178 family protein [Betaproteobacteria bacterium]